MDLEQKEEHKQITIKDVVEANVCYENIDGDIHTWMNVVNVNVDLHIQRNKNVDKIKILSIILIGLSYISYLRPSLFHLY